MGLNSDFIQEANKLINEAKKFNISEITIEIVNLTNSIEFKFKPDSNAETDKESFGFFSGIAQTFSSVAKTLKALMSMKR